MTVTINTTAPLQVAWELRQLGWPEVFIERSLFGRQPHLQPDSYQRYLNRRLQDRRDVLDELLHMISCKAAIKAGDRLSPEEISALLELRDQYQDSHHCPHGRPTSLVFTRDELDRRFKRI